MLGFGPWRGGKQPLLARCRAPLLLANRFVLYADCVRRGSTSQPASPPGPLPPMADTLLRQLGPLSKGFTGPATNVAAARQLRELADGLSDRMNPGELENGMLQSIRQLSNASKAELFRWVQPALR